MTKRLILLPGPTNVGAGKTLYLDCPMGYRYHAVFLKLKADTGTNLPCAASNGTGAWLQDISIKLGGKVQRLTNGLDLNLANTLKGSTFGAVTVGSSASNYGQIVPIYFGEPWRKDIYQADYPAWPTGNGQQLQIEANIGTPTGTAPTVSCTAYALVDTGKQPGDKLNIVKWYRSDFTPASAVDVTTLDTRDVYQAIYVKQAVLTTTQAVYSKVTLKADGVPIVEVQDPTTQAAVMKLIDNNSGQFGAELILDGFDPLQDGFPAGNVRDLQLRVESSTVGTGVLRVITERLGPPD
jgi:hypothetical protein